MHDRSKLPTVTIRSAMTDTIVVERSFSQETLEIERAADDESRSLNIILATDSPIPQFTEEGIADVVLFMRESNLPEKLPLLDSHGGTFEGLSRANLGEIGEPRLNAGKRTSSLIMRASFDPEHVRLYERYRDRVLTDFSIRAELDTSTMERINPGESKSIGGKTFRAKSDRPTLVVMDWTATEGSAVFRGADPKAKVIRGSFGPENMGRKTMNPALRAFIVSRGMDPEKLSEEQVATLRKAFEANFSEFVLRNGFTSVDGLTEVERSTLEDVYANELTRGKLPVAGGKGEDPTPKGAGSSNAPKSGEPAPAPTPPAPPAESAEETARRVMYQENQRVESLRSLCTGEGQEKLLQQAITERWSYEKAAAEVLKAERAQRPVGAPAVIVNEGATSEVLEAAVMMRSGKFSDEQLMGLYGKGGSDQVLETARGFQSYTMMDVVKEVARMHGVLGRMDKESVLRAGFSTTAIPGLLNNIANKALLKSFNSRPATAFLLSTIGTVNDFKNHERYRMNAEGNPVIVPNGGNIEFANVDEQKAEQKIDTYALAWAFTRQDIINDDLGALMKMPIELGRKYALNIDKIFYTRLLDNNAMTDGNPIFSGPHANDAAGAALSASVLSASIKLMLDQKDTSGDPIAVNPKYLLVGTGNTDVADEILNSRELMVSGGDASAAVAPQGRQVTRNPFLRYNMQPVTSPFLSNTTFNSEADDNKWYLFGDPNEIDTFEIAFLDGQREPTIREVGMPVQQLGMSWQSYHDVGVREQEWRGMVRNVGV